MSTPEEKDKHEAALQQFASAEPGPASLTPAVEEVLQFIGRTGCNCYPWEKVLPVIAAKLESVLSSEPAPEDTAQFEQDKTLALESLKAFSEAPFTLQRLCEFLCDPTMTGGRKAKVVWAILKLVCISSTIPQEPYLYEKPAQEEGDSQEGMPRSAPIPPEAIAAGGDDFNPQAVFPGAAPTDAAAPAEGAAPAEAPSDPAPEGA
eukprot:TRINITY_DN11296_c0_g1_i1.p1 TRINITY_DN11296_c0_g1~~TRINITY_DN11296_c0_g1_i1.p1  ORF type:complete len:205 (+),score=74.99 TRINITY_DN11296_c0_g1_i1:111-725(+)